MILVTGGLGFLGRRLVRQLLASGEEDIRLLVRPGTCHTRLEEAQLDANRIELFPASFQQAEALNVALKDVDVVYHLAASRVGTHAVQVANTLIGTENLFSSALHAQVRRIVLVSSFSVMGVQNIKIIDESVPLEPKPQWREPYAFAKLRQEELARKYIREHQLPIVIVRPGVIYGPGVPLLTSRIGIWLGRTFFHLGGRNVVPLTHVENCAEACMRAGQVEGIEGETFHICDDQLPTARQILRQYQKRVERLRCIKIPYWLLQIIGQLNELYSNKTQGHLPLVFRPYMVDSMWKSRAYRNCKAKQKLGWTPRVSIEAGIRETLEFIASSRHS